MSSSVQSTPEKTSAKVPPVTWTFTCGWSKQLNISCVAQSREVKQAFSEFSLMSKYYRMQEQKCLKYYRSVKKKRLKTILTSLTCFHPFMKLALLQRVRRDEQSLVLNFYSTFNGCKDTAEVSTPLCAVGLYLAFLQRWQILFYSFETVLSLKPWQAFFFGLGSKQAFTFFLEVRQSEKPFCICRTCCFIPHRPKKVCGHWVKASRSHIISVELASEALDAFA